jgi:ACT domain-containing protein
MEVMKLAGISRNSYYKYKRELFEQLEREALQEDEKNM